MEEEQVSNLEIGEYLNRYFKRRTIRLNKNVLGVFTGKTGSSKSYNCLSCAERWYQFHFKKEFPIENCCFSPKDIVKRIKELKDNKQLRKGTLFILEEAGTNLGNLDYQNKIQKMFTYILQSFRSMNLILLINLPVFSMLNKATRELVHFNFISERIDFKNKISLVKPLFLQLNEQYNKTYWHNPTGSVNGYPIQLSLLQFTMPPKRLTELYEAKKLNYVSDLTEIFLEEIAKEEKIKDFKHVREDLTKVEREVYQDLMNDLSVQESAKIRDRGIRSTYDARKRIISKGYSLNQDIISK